MSETMKLKKYQGRIAVGTLALIAFMGLPALAAPTVVPPDAGTVGKSPVPPAPAAPKIDTEVQEAQKPAAPASVGMKVLVKQFRITGQDIYPEAALAGLCRDYVGKELSLTELNQAADHITAYFRAHGYIVATAWLPAQTVKDGIVEIQVVVGHYGEIQLRNKSSLEDGVLKNILGSLASGDLIRKDELDATLLSLSDTSGIMAKATLKPGRAAGTSDLVVDVANGKKVNGYVYADNWGNRYTGHNRLGVTANVNNVSGKGDKFTVGGLYSGKGMWDYDLSYLVPIDGHGTKFGLSWSQMHYDLGSEFSQLNATGISKTATAWLSMVLRRSRNFNMNGLLSYSDRQLQDCIAVGGTDSQKSLRAITAGINGDFRDTFGGGGYNSFSLTGTTGHLSADSPDSLTSTATAGTRGGYQKANFVLSRLQAVNDRVNLSFSLSGQLASRNLDSAEKMTFGGPGGVRGYGVGSALGDTGYLFTGEVRWNMPVPEYQLAFFYDTANFTTSKSEANNKRVIAGAGIGFIWNRNNDCYVRLDYAWPITPADRMADGHTSSGGHLWLQAVKYF